MQGQNDDEAHDKSHQMRGRKGGKRGLCAWLFLSFVSERLGIRFVRPQGGDGMRVYLDNCCYNRPFDDQSQPSVRLETEAKLLIQTLMRSGVIEYAWSFELRLESSKNPSRQRKRSITAWADGAIVDIAPAAGIRARAKDLMALGVKAADAIHLACAESAECDWFFTVDRGILKKVRELGNMRIANPVDFVLEGMKWQKS